MLFIDMGAIYRRKCYFKNSVTIFIYFTLGTGIAFFLGTNNNDLLFPLIYMLCVATKPSLWQW